MRKKKDTWKDQFISNTTRVGFMLKLSRPMLEFLCATSDSVHWDRARYGGMYEPDNWICTERALTQRGLIERVGPTKDVDIPPWALTPVGESVVEMLKVGGLFIPADKALKKLSKRKGRR